MIEEERVLNHEIQSCVCGSNESETVIEGEFILIVCCGCGRILSKQWM
jgi:hypothetical protein